MPKNLLSEYQASAAQEAQGEIDPHRLIQMLLDGALDRIARAKGHISRQEFASKGECISDAIAIVGCLHESLDLEKGGEIAANLDKLYGHVSDTLLLASAKNELEPLEQVTDILKKIKSAWDAIREEALDFMEQMKDQPAKKTESESAPVIIENHPEEEVQETPSISLSI